jgi:hypothetical protein
MCSIVLPAGIRRVNCTRPVVDADRFIFQQDGKLAIPELVQSYDRQVHPQLRSARVGSC